MQHLELPVDCQTLLVFGGCYGNLQATEALIAKAHALGVSPRHVICTGDLVAYCAQPKETVQLLIDWGCHVLMGNCEESLAQDSEDCGCGFEEGTACAVLSDQWFQYSRSRVSDDQKQWMGHLPREIRFEWGGNQFSVVHGSASSINEFVFESADNAFFDRQFAVSQSRVILGGHCGLPFTKMTACGVWHNAGVIGMPANDGQTNTWFSLIHLDENEFVFESKPLIYDHPSATRMMKKNGLNNGYAKGLSTGLWPSLDVLPQPEKLNTGKPLEPKSFRLNRC